MEPNSLPGGMYSTMGSGMLGLEMSLHHQPQPIPSQNPNVQHSPHPQMMVFGHSEPDHHSQSQKQGYPINTQKAKPQQLTLSDEDEPGITNEDSGGDGKRKASPWQRMKWTDNMVRLLIMVVYYIGDEASSEAADPKKKGGGFLQKKGKWKSVSRAMMERGFYVSPQQCEDKFNDLNKRYKRVNDILGKGTACRVVENQSLLDSMDHLSPKMKEEVKKLLNSKHLFFREMCAYHNTCAGGAGASGASPSTEGAGEPTQIQQQQPAAQQQQQRCFHASVHNASMGPNSGRVEEDDYDEEDEEDEDEEEDDEDGAVGSGLRGHEDEDGGEERAMMRKRARKGGMWSPATAALQQMAGEMASVLQDAGKSGAEKRQWVKGRLMQLEELRVGYHYEELELEKQRLKWVKFSSKKEREMEREKLKNERMMLENERMVLLLRQKELELGDLQHQQQQGSSSKRSDPSPISG
ncbi:trihelix transcription factor DF1 isoform X1 [Diospyros lotus]|uniref:trihelix transcription factor DF1 isoform X1 n=2 Tax=Diospyros lotus TaxID=55363 RepID=UPI00225906EF|nr:trihelix transcription factor DF1 isoform X1 [Diospyros lotus]